MSNHTSTPATLDRDAVLNYRISYMTRSGARYVVDVQDGVTTVQRIGTVEVVGGDPWTDAEVFPCERVEVVPCPGNRWRLRVTGGAMDGVLSSFIA